MLLVSQSVVSFHRWAVLVGVLGQLCLSTQALWERITPRAVAFLQAVLAHVLHRRRARVLPAPPAALTTFPRVLIQDSTMLKLSPIWRASFLARTINAEPPMASSEFNPSTTCGRSASCPSV